jgi:hypothetical protein
MTLPSEDMLRRLGASLREIDPGTLQDDPDEGAVRWFLGETGTELFAWTREGPHPDHVQLVFARVQLEWTDSQGLLTRHFRPGGSTAGGRYDAYLLAASEGLDQEVCEGALTLLRASALPDEVRDPLLQALERAVSPSDPPAPDGGPG